MKNNEKEPLTLKEARQIDIISKYHDVDLDNRIITLNLHYEKASELIVPNIVRKEPMIKTEIVEELASTILLFPRGFNCEIKLICDDYEDIEPKQLLNSFRDNLEMLHYAGNKQRGKTWIAAAIFFIISFVLLSLKLVLSLMNVLNADSVLYEMMDIISWVFLWQSVTLLFLTPNEIKNASNMISKVLLSIGFYDKNKKLLIESDRKEMAASWIKDSTLEKTAKALAVVGSALVIATGITDFFNFILQIYSVVTAASKTGLTLSIVLICITITESIIFILGGTSGINSYRGHGPLKKAYPVFAHIFMLFTIFAIGFVIVFSIVMKLNVRASATLIIGSVVALFSAIIYFVSYLLLSRYRKKEKAFIESQKESE